jgi:hypothetical protein
VPNHHVNCDYDFDPNPWQDLPHSLGPHSQAPDLVSQPEDTGRLGPPSRGHASEMADRTSGISHVYHPLINGM